MHAFAQKPKATEHARSAKSHIVQEQAQASRGVLETPPRLRGAIQQRAGWDFSKIPLYSQGRRDGPERPSPAPVRRLLGPVQRKLNVGAIDDPVEHEADRVADQVMRMPR